MVAPSSFGSDKIHTWKYYSDPSAGDTKGWHGSDPVDRYICDDKVTLGNLWLAPLGESNVDRGFWRKFLPSAVETNILFTKIFPSLQLVSNLYRALEYVASVDHAPKTIYHELSSVQLTKS